MKLEPWQGHRSAYARATYKETLQAGGQKGLQSLKRAIIRQIYIRTASEIRISPQKTRHIVTGKQEMLNTKYLNETQEERVAKLVSIQLTANGFNVSEFDHD